MTQGAAMVGKEAMDAALGLYFPPLFAAYALNGGAGYPGPMSDETLAVVHGHFLECGEHAAEAARLAPDAASALSCWSYHSLAFGFPRQHMLPAFDPAALFGADGERLRTTIEE